VKHNAHLIDLDSADRLEAAARLAGFADLPAAELRRQAGPGAVLLRLDRLRPAESEVLERVAGDRGLGLILERSDDGGGARLLLAAGRDRLHELADGLGPEQVALGRELQELLQDDARREWTWRVRGRELRPGRRTLVMGVVNVTPDSFSDGGRYLDPGRAVAHGLEMISAGADLLDIGGESTRPGARRVGALEEQERILPVIRGLSRQADVTLSVDTSRAEVARAALDVGARVINDISALKFDPAMAPLAAGNGAGLILMHMQGSPESMQRAPSYRDVVGEVAGFLREAMGRAVRDGVAPAQIVVDPGIGFGKRLEHNLALLRHAGSLRALGRPVLVGASRKSLLGEITGRPVAERLASSAAAAAAAVAAGASLVRVHDVAETVDTVRVLDAVRWGGVR
jgi:dihydropteroate synthase